MINESYSLGSPLVVFFVVFELVYFFCRSIANPEGNLRTDVGYYSEYNLLFLWIITAKTQFAHTGEHEDCFGHSDLFGRCRGFSLSVLVLGIVSLAHPNF